MIDTSALSDVQVLDTQTMSWASPFIRYPVCSPRSDHSSALLTVGGRSMVLVLGGTNPGRGNKGMWDLALLNVGEDLRDHIAKKAAAAKDRTAAAPAKAPAKAGAAAAGAPASAAASSSAPEAASAQTKPAAAEPESGGNSAELLALLSRIQASTPAQPASSAAGTGAAPAPNKPRAKWGK